jgi:anti-sigma factor ChrR (cupin superfamily)
MAALELDGPTTLLLYGTEIAVIARKPAPPGARVDAVAVADDGSRSAFRIKVHRCKRQPDGTFVLVGVTIDLRREGRAVLEQLQAAAPGLPKGI